MKRILSIILMLALLMCFTACKKSKSSSDQDSIISEISSVQTENKVESEDEQTSSETVSDLESTPSESTPIIPECAHKYSVATCTAASKCTLCGILKSNALGHKYTSGKCSRCGIADPSVPTYKASGKDTIIRTVNGKSTTIKIDMTEANEHINKSDFRDSFSYDISYTKFYEADGWLYFAQTISTKCTVNEIVFEETIDELFRVKTDGNGLTNITPNDETANRGLDAREIFGFYGNEIYFVVSYSDRGTNHIYKAPISNNSKNIVIEGEKIADSFNNRGGIYNCSIKNGYLYFSEKYASKYIPETGSFEKILLGDYKVKLDGTGITKIS